MAFEVADEWPEVAYSGPVVGKQNPWDVNDAVHVAGTGGPPNPQDFDSNIARHDAHTDENASVQYDQYGRRSGAVGMNTLLDGTYQHPSQVQPGIGTTNDSARQTDMLANATADGTDDWPHMVDMIGKQSDAIEVRVAPNRDCLLMTAFIPAAAGGANGVIQILARDPRRQRFAITNVGTGMLVIGSHEGDVQNIPTGAGVFAAGTVFYLAPAQILYVYYDGDMWAANSLTTPGYMSIMVERDR